MKYQTDVIEDQKVLRRGRQDVLVFNIYTILLFILFAFIEFKLFP